VSWLVEDPDRGTSTIPDLSQELGIQRVKVRRPCASPLHGELEEDADELMEQWGFDSQSIDEWGVQVGLARRIECKDLEEFLFRSRRPGSRYQKWDEKGEPLRRAEGTSGQKKPATKGRGERKGKGK